MSVRNGQLAIASHANVAVTSGRFTPLTVEVPSPPQFISILDTTRPYSPLNRNKESALYYV